MYKSSKYVTNLYNVSNTTLQNWSNSGKINSMKLPSGHRRYFINNQLQTNRNNYIYCRVSSGHQKDDLERQVKYLQNLYPSYILIKDIGSGLNYKRVGFLKLIKKVINNEVNSVIVSSTDRFCRFGYEFYEWLFNQFSSQLISLSKIEKKNDFTEDLMAIIGYFNAKFNGQRKYTINK